MQVIIFATKNKYSHSCNLTYNVTVIASYIISIIASWFRMLFITYTRGSKQAVSLHIVGIVTELINISSYHGAGHNTPCR